MRRRAIGALLLAVLLHGAGSCPKPVLAQEPESCEPPSPEGLRALADALSLDDDQLAWLLTREAAGRLRAPDDLDDMPASGTALRDLLAASICWDDGWEHRVLAGGRTVTGGFRRDLRIVLDHGSWEGTGRLRTDPDSRILRGGIGFARGPWNLAAGTLSARRALGLLGGVSGGFGNGVTLRPARGGWSPSLAVDPERPRGMHLGYAGSKLALGVGWMRGRIRNASGAIDTAGWVVTGARWRRDGLTLEVSGVGAWGWSLAAFGPAGSGSWGVEWARAGGGSALAATWGVEAGAWRARAGAVRTGPGYRVPTRTRWARSRDEDRVLIQVEVRWQRVRRRFLRVRLEGERDPGDASGDWGVERGIRELEAGERVAMGWWAGLLWRTRSTAPLARDPEAGTNQLFRCDLERRAAPWRTRIRWEERRAADGDLRTLALRFGRGRERAWEVRAAVVRSRNRPPAASWYRRRAGGQYGWDPLEAGTWVGGWGRLTVGTCRLEVSVDRRRTGWDVAVAVAISSG